VAGSVDWLAGCYTTNGRSLPWRMPRRSGVRDFVTSTSLRELLGAAGYPDRQVLEDYDVWLPSGGIARVTAVAFGRPSPLDMSTATMVCSDVAEANGHRSTLDAAQALAAPITLVRHENRWRALPSVPSTGEMEGIDVDINQAESLRLLDPERLLAGKMGARQLPLFNHPVNLLTGARSRYFDSLSPIVEAAVSMAEDLLQGTRGQTIRTHRRAARAVVGALTILALRDKASDRPWRELSNGALLDVAAQEHTETLGWLAGADSAERRVVEAILRELGTGINYASLDPSVLSEVYETTLVTDDERKSLGIHYTPPRLARQILEALPVETLAPESRDVLDPACGSGSLLVAAHDRLRVLQPAEWSEDVRHRDLVVHLHGIDVDPFAAEIARLTLFLHAMPTGNGWRIEDRDTLKALIEPDDRPSVVVMNPPWRFARGGGTTEIASRFVDWAMEALRPGGLFAFVVPQSWLSSRTTRQSRRTLQDACDLFEAWTLPPGAFPSSNAPSAVMFGRKGGRQGGRTIRWVTKPGLELFRTRGRSSATHRMTAAAAAQTRPLIEGALHHACRAWEGRRLADVAEILLGAQPYADWAPRDQGVPFLSSFRHVDAFGEPPQTEIELARHPEDFWRPRPRRFVAAHKVIVSAIKHASPWALKVGMDRRGVLPSNSTYMVVPKDSADETLLAALALLGSGFASCWVDEITVGNNIQSSALEALPWPEVPTSELAELGRRLFLARARGDFLALTATVLQLEATISAAMGIGSGVETLVASRLAGAEAPEGVMRYPTTTLDGDDGQGVRRFGAVLEELDGLIRVFVSDVTDRDGLVIPVPERMPGALARAGMTFDVTLTSTRDLANGEYRLQPVSYDEFMGQ
jgi:hypothetical protein